MKVILESKLDALQAVTALHDWAALEGDQRVLAHLSKLQALIYSVHEPGTPLQAQWPAESTPDALLAELRARLQLLRRHNGEPSTREIASRASKAISHQTVNVVLRCEKSPSWGRLRLVVEALGGDVAEFQHLWIAVRNAFDESR